MELTEEAYWLWLCNIDKVGRKTAYRLLSAFGGPKDVCGASEKTLRSLGFLTDAQIRNILDKDFGSVEKILRDMEKKKIKTVRIGGKGYPARLLNIPDPPILLYYKGAAIDDMRPAAAIVGSRKCSEYGRRMAYGISRELSRHGVRVISGMACGIDGEAQKGCLSAGGITSAVLGCGADVCYPKSNIELYAMIEQTGSIISEYVPGTEPKQGFFPERNRLISGLSDVVAVIEAGKRSGSFITADCALEQGKDVYAVPGRTTDVQSMGCNMLIKNGAGLLENAEDMLDALKIRRDGDDSVENIGNKYGLATDEKIVYAKLGLEPKHIDGIAAETGMPVERVMGAVLNLEMKHVIRKAANNYYVKEI